MHAVSICYYDALQFFQCYVAVQFLLIGHAQAPPFWAC